MVVAVPQRLVGGQRRHAVPLGRVGTGNACPRQPRQLCCRAGPHRVVDRARRCAHHRAQPADQGGRSQHPAARGPVRRFRCRDRWPSAASSWQNGDGSIDSSPLSLSTAVTSSRLRARPIAAISSLRSSASSGALARQAAVRLASTTPSRTSTSCWVPSTPPRGIVLGHSPSCRPGDDDELPFPAERRVRAEDRDRVGRPVVDRGRPRAAPVALDVVDQAAQRRAGGARHVLLGDVEQRGDRVEVAVGLRAGGATALTGRQPAPLQAGPVPCLPQRVARVAPVGGAAARRGEHGAHPSQRPSVLRRPARRGARASQRVDEQVAEVAWRLRPSARRSARRSCRSDTGSTRPIGPGQQRQRPRRRRGRRAVASSTVSSARTAGWSASGALGAGGVHRHTCGGQRARQRRAQPGHRPHDHRHLRPRHAVDEMRAAQRVGDQRGLGVRRRGDPHASASPAGPSAPVMRACARRHPAAAARPPLMASRDGGCAAMRLGRA